MAAGVMPKLGEPTTCETTCSHSDCMFWRKTIGSPCDSCGRPINAGQRYYQRENKTLVHASCIEGDKEVGDASADLD